MNNFDWNDNSPEISFLHSGIKFNQSAISILGSPDKIAIGFDINGKNIFAVRPANKDDKMVFAISRKRQENRPVYIQCSSLLKKISRDYHSILHRKKSAVTIRLTTLASEHTLICDYTELLSIMNDVR